MYWTIYTENRCEDKNVIIKVPLRFYFHYLRLNISANLALNGQAWCLNILSPDMAARGYPSTSFAIWRVFHDVTAQGCTQFVVDGLPRRMDHVFLRVICDLDVPSEF